MPKRVYKLVDGEFVQIEGPLWEGPMQGETIWHCNCPDTTGGKAHNVDCPLGKAPSVVVPVRHRSAG